VNQDRQGQESLAKAWLNFERLNSLLLRYLKTSEEEFSSLIEALDSCWTMAENVQKETARLSEFTNAASGSQTAVIRESLLEACGVFKAFLIKIEGGRRQLAATSHETGGLLATARHLQENIAPLTHIAFHFRLEASRLSPTDGVSVGKAYDDMKQVVSLMKTAGDSQQSALLVILDKLSTATRSVEQNCVSYTVKAAESEQNVTRHLDLLATVPRDLLRVRDQANAQGSVLADSIREAVKALQGHDSLRQRLEHILGALACLRDDKNRQEEPGHALLLQRQQARSLLGLVLHTGSRIEQELNSVIQCAQGIAGDGATRSASGHDLEQFEEGVTRLASLSAEVGGLLEGEATMGKFVIAEIEPIREMLSAKSRELETVAGSMKRLALNVLVDADKIPSARGLGVLGVWTSEVAEDVLQLARDQNKQFVQLGATLQAESAVIAAAVLLVESCRGVLTAQKATDALRDSRRTECDAVNRLCREASHLQERTETLLRSLKFVDEARGLLADLEVTIDLLLSLYPKSEKPFDLDAASAGYTMREQHEVHVMVSGGETENAERLPKPASGQDYGANVELF
jgi:hypothetical protein